MPSRWCVSMYATMLDTKLSTVAGTYRAATFVDSWPAPPIETRIFAPALWPAVTKPSRNMSCEAFNVIPIGDEVANAMSTCDTRYHGMSVVQVLSDPRQLGR